MPLDGNKANNGILSHTKHGIWEGSAVNIFRFVLKEINPICQEFHLMIENGFETVWKSYSVFKKTL